MEKYAATRSGYVFSRLCSMQQTRILTNDAPQTP